MKGRVLTRWEPEDAEFWEHTGKRIAQRNLWISIPNLLLAFAVWMIWSVVVVNLPHVGFDYSTNELFWLAALPGLSGAALRLVFAFMVPVLGGRRWQVISTTALLLPAVGTGIAVQNPDTPFAVMLVLSLLCGLGGGNFASSMANVSVFFPRSQQGTALGLNAGLGNLGVSLAQFLMPLVIAVSVFGSLGGEAQSWVQGETTREVWLQNAGFIWVPFILICSACAWLGMNDLPGSNTSITRQMTVFRRRQIWPMAWLYVGTFGSFVGYAAGFPLLLHTQFTHADATQYAFLGPLIGALARPVGGWLADRSGGARVTLWCFVFMTASIAVLLWALPVSTGEGSLPMFVVTFMVLFICAGIGNGSVFTMIPTALRAEHLEAARRLGIPRRQAEREAARESAAALGLVSAVAAFGGFFIPKSYGTSIALTGGAEAALYLAMLFYATCIALTWRQYARRYAPIPC